MVHLRFPVLLPILALALGGCVLQFEASDDFEMELGAQALEELAFCGFDGDVDFRGVTTDTARLRGTRTAVGATKEVARQNLEYAELEVAISAQKAELEFDPPLEYTGLVDLELDKVSTLPESVSISISLEDGDVAVDGIHGDLTLSTREGEVSVVDGEGSLLVMASRGGVDLESSGEIFSTSSGPASVFARGQNENGVLIVTDGAPVTFGIPPQDFEIVCFAKPSDVEVAEALEVEQKELDKQVILTSGTGARSIKIFSGGGPISIEAISP